MIYLLQMQLSRGVIVKRCFENKQQIYRRTLFVSQVALLLKVFSLVTFTVLRISFVNIKVYFDWQKPSHVTFSPCLFFFFFCILFFYCKVFSRLKNKHCNINIEVSFSCPAVVKFYKHPCQRVIPIKLQSNFIEIKLRYGCSPLNLLRISRTPFPKNNSGGLTILYLLQHALFHNHCLQGT